MNWTDILHYSNQDVNFIIWAIGMIYLSVIMTKALNKVTPSNEPKEDIKP